jgi:ribosome-binding protein aMBF1 (putative translation factor)
MTKIDELHRKWSKDPAYRDAYQGLEEEFQLAETLIAARTRAGLSQTQLADKMKTSQSYIGADSP